MVQEERWLTLFMTKVKTQTANKTIICQSILLLIFRTWIWEEETFSHGTLNIQLWVSFVFCFFFVSATASHTNQQHVPIRPETVPCSRSSGNPCCLVHFCTIVLAWATTVHKFQGFEARFREHDTVNCIIADISNLQWEKLHPGTTYVVVSRARTLGTRDETEDQIMDSALYFDCPIGPERFTKTKID